MDSLTVNIVGILFFVRAASVGFHDWTSSEHPELKATARSGLTKLSPQLSMYSWYVLIESLVCILSQ